MNEQGINFRIGVTGHRDIAPDSIETTRQESRNFLAQLQALLPNSGITVISGMADGADRIFAMIALEMGVKVEAVLPMPWEHYRNDFEGASRTELEEILSRSDVKTIELPLPPELGRDEQTWLPGARDELYSSLSHDLKLRANILVTFWDGHFNQLTGGTGDTLLAYLGVPSPDDAAEVIIEEKPGSMSGDGAVAFWVPVERTSTSSPETGEIISQQAKWLTAFGENIYQSPVIPDDFKQELILFDQFNRDHAEHSNEQSLVSYGNLLDNCAEELGEDTRHFKATDRAYVMADSLALYHQSQSDRLFKLFSLMAASMGLLFLVYAKLAAAQWLLVGYLALFFGGVFLNARGNNREWFTRHLVYRCLAETLRIRFYLDLAGAHNRIDIQKLLQTTGISNLKGFSWVRYVLRSTRPAPGQEEATDMQANLRIESVRKNWISDQASYFEKKSHNLHKHHHGLEKIKQGIIAGLVVAAIILVFFKKTLVGIDFGNHLSLKTLLIFMMGLLPFWLGVWEIYQNKMAIKELMWQYLKQGERFSLINKVLEQSSQLEFKRDTLARLGETSIIENCLWIIQRFHRDHEPPTAG